MKKNRLKKGRVERVADDRVTILNLDGQCRDILSVIPQDAEYIMDEIGIGEEVLYFVEGDKLVQIELDRAMPELQDLYEALPKEIGCVTAA